jgi:hypothetical protein
MTETPKQPGQLAQVREDVDAAVGAADLATHMFVARFGRDLKHCTEADRDGLLVRFAITWLLANGLVVTAPDSAFEQLLPLDLPAELAGDVGGKLHEAIARKAHFDGLVSARPADWAE